MSDKSKPIQSNSMLMNLMIGGCSGIISRTCTAPIELYKIQKQTFFLPNSNLSHVLKHDGLPGLWKGNTINCFRIFPQTAIHYVGNSVFFNMIHSITPYDKSFDLLVAGSLGGLLASFLTYPFETIRTRISVQSNHEKQCRTVASMLRQMSISEIYRGVSLHMLGHTPFNALTFTFYHTYRQWFLNYSNRTNNLCSGFLAGSTAVLFTYPTDTIRRRLQLQGFNEYVPKYNSVRDCIITMYKKEGLFSFYRGLHAGILKMGFAMSIQFTLFAEFQKIYQRTNSGVTQ